MSTGGQKYEFTQDQNAQIGGLADKMGWVGLFFNVVGILGIFTALVLILAIYKNSINIPAEWVNKAPDEVQKQVQEWGTKLDQLPPKNQLWGFVINAGLAGLVYLLIGIWTRSAASSFSKIVTTQGADITHLMNALGALHKMYALLYTLLLAAAIMFFVTLGVSIWSMYRGG